jgi:hypothetical protein
VTEEQQAAVDEFCHAARAYMKVPNAGTRYAFEMAATECQLLGVDPQTIVVETDPPGGLGCD